MVYKVIQWASGNVGAHAVRTVAERDDLKLVGMFTYSGDKAGKDAGWLSGTKALGVKATSDIEEIIALDADVVIHTPLPSLVYGRNRNADVQNFCRLLASGKNVITTVGYMYPQVYGRGLMRKLEEACRKGGATFHGTGLNPGWLGDLLPLSMSALSKTIEQIHVREISNFQGYPSPEIMFEMMGFGKTPEDFKRDSERFTYWLSSLFRENVQMIADGLGIKLDNIKETFTRETAKKNFDVAAGRVKKGTVAGQHWEWAGMVGNRKAIVHETVWRMHEDVGKSWPTGKHSVRIKGEPNMHIEFDPLWIDDGLLGTATHAVNAIPTVVDAPQGVKTFLDLPWIFGKGAGPRKKTRRKKS